MEIYVFGHKISVYISFFEAQEANKIQNKQKFIYKLSLRDKNYTRFSQELNCFMDVKLFSALLKKDYNWNMSIGGSLIMFERYPEKFFPDVSFSLNFLTI